jgi:hypothetical protein
MGFVALLLHISGFVAPAVGVALCTTLMGRWQGGGASRMRWWLEWAVASAAGALVLGAAMWVSGHDGTALGYAALITCCATLAWLPSLRQGR